MTDGVMPLQTLAVVSTTVAAAEQAHALVQAIMQRRLAACVQVEAITAHYYWREQLQEEVEWRLQCKTLPALAPALLALLEKIHPYGLPQLLLHEVQASAEYAAWVAQAVDAAGSAAVAP